MANQSTSFSIIRRSGILLALIGLVSLSACASWREASVPDPEQELRERGATTTGLSAAAGAAIGAAAGLVVGSTTGAPGEGMALGALAGAATGGLVGNKFEEYEETIAENEEVVTRHEESIQQKDREIDDLKRQLERLDRKPSTNAHSFSVDGYDGNPRAKPFRTRVASIPQSRATMNTNVQPNFSNESDIDLSFTNDAPTIRDTAIESVQPTKPQLPGLKAVKKTPQVEVKKVTTKQPIVAVAPKKTVVAKKVEPKKEVKEVVEKAKEDEDEKLPPASGAVESVPLMTTKLNTTGCTKAAEEAQRAGAAASNADKLFYLRRALRLCPKEPAYHLKAGEVYAAIGRRDDAEFEFRRTIELDPENEQAHEQLMLLTNEGA